MNMSDEIDRDAELIGIDPKVWKEFRGMTDEKYVQDDLPYFQQQDDREAFIRHKEAMARRAFAWYRLSKKKDKSKLIDIYNGIATMKQRD